MYAEQESCRVDLDEAAVQFRRRQPDDASAREQFVRLCLPLAHRLALRYRGRGEPFADLEQVARLGLVKAVDRYDPARGAFTGFAAITILGEVRRHFRDRTWGVRAPRRLQDLARQVRQIDGDLAITLSRTPSRVELAAQVATSVDEVDQALLSSAGYTLMSLNLPVTDSSDADEYGDLIGELDPDLEAVDDRVTVRTLMDLLPDRERQILILRFYGNLTQTQIAQRCGLSQMHVSRLLSKTLTWLRHAMLADAPPFWNEVEDTMGGPRLRVTILAAGSGALTVAVCGEVDRDNVGELRQAILDALGRRPAKLYLDLAGVPFIDAAGISALVAAYREAARATVQLRLRDPQPHVRRILAAAKLPYT